MDPRELIIRNYRGVIDSTLREGYQFLRSNFSLEDEKRIFTYLAGIGVEYVEVGNPAQEEIRRMITELLKTRNWSSVRVLCHVRNHERDVERTLEIGADGVNILCTVDAERLAAMGKSLEEYKAVLRNNVRAAKEGGLEVRVGVEDFFGQPAEASREIYSLAEESGVDRIALADTRGRALGWEVARGVGELRRRTAAAIEVHFHNDLGHAVSNALTALEAGANYVSASLLGIGERTGVTPLSSLLINLYLMDDKIGRRYDLSLLTEAENNLSRMCGMEMPPHLLTNRANGFAHKAGIHLDALVKFGPQKYEALSPKLIGNARKLVINTIISGKTGPEELKQFEEKYG